MIEVVLFHEKPMSVMAIVAEMRECGYVQRRDFDFAYHPGTTLSGELIPRHTVFTFYAESLATWFALKYVT